MIKNSFILLAILAFVTSCNKRNDHTLTKVGFYFLDSLSSGADITTNNLYVDNVYKGKLHSLKYEARCGDTMLVYVTLDSKRHEVEVKNDAGEYVSSEYLQISKNKSATGTGKNSDRIAEGHTNGFACSSKDDCTTFGFFK